MELPLSRTLSRTMSKDEVRDKGYNRVGALVIRKESVVCSQRSEHEVTGKSGGL